MNSAIMTNPTRSAMCLLLWLCAPAAWGMAATPEELLDEAVQEYRTALDSTDREERIQKFRQAEMLFTRLAEGDSKTPAEGIRNADLYVNLGNAAMGAERLGPAILAYRRALILDPDHHRARQNLAHARTLLPDWVPCPEEGGLLDTFFAWSGRLSPAEYQTLAALAFLVTAALIAAAIRWRQPLLRSLAVLPGLAWLLLLGTILFLVFGHEDDDAVLTLPEVIARSADSAGASPRFPQPLPGGTEVKVLETRDEWTRVRLFDGRDAWLPRSAMQIVAL